MKSVHYKMVCPRCSTVISTCGCDEPNKDVIPKMCSKCKFKPSKKEDNA